MAFKINVVQNKLESYRPYGIIGIPKVGKSSFFRDLVIKYTGSSKGGLLISCGNENGYKHLDNLQYEVAQVWNKEYGKYEEDLPEELKTRGLVQIIDELVETKQTNGIKLVAFDTIDELYQMAWGQVREEHRKQFGEYPKSINSALGGYGSSRKRIIELVNQQIDRLSNAGYGVFLIGHTKAKTKEDILTGVSYEVITNNLEDNFFNAIEARCQMVMNFVQEFDFKNITSETEKGFDGKTHTKEVGEVGSSTRYIYFRDSGLVHASCNFPNVPTKVELSVDNFLKVFNDAVNASRSTKLTQEQVKEEIKKEDELNNLKVKAVQNKENEGNSEEKDDLISNIKDTLKTKISLGGVKEKVMAKVTELGINPKDYNVSNYNTLKEFYSFINNL